MTARQKEAGRKNSMLNLLIVESEKDIQDLYKSFLRDCSITIVDTGEQCLNFLKNPEGNFDTIIIDSHIKGLGALETISKIRQIAPGQHLIITSTNSSEFKARARNAGLGIDDGAIDFLNKPFRFSQLLSHFRSKIPRVSKIGLADHVLAIYENGEEELSEAVAFLKRSVQNNEVALFIVRKDHDIAALKTKMQSYGIDVDSLASNDSLIVMHNEDWYLPDKRVDKNRIIEQWNKLVERSTAAGKKGLRAFCMMDCFFDHGFAEEVVDYEHTLPVKFEMPFVPICAYRRQDIDTLSEEQMKRLVTCHNHVWTSNRTSD